jgi:hypothetical protein
LAKSPGSQGREWVKRECQKSRVYDETISHLIDNKSEFEENLWMEKYLFKN